MFFVMQNSLFSFSVFSKEVEQKKRTKGPSLCLSPSLSLSLFVSLSLLPPHLSSGRLLPYMGMECAVALVNSVRGNASELLYTTGGIQRGGAQVLREHAHSHPSSCCTSQLPCMFMCVCLFVYTHQHTTDVCIVE